MILSSIILNLTGYFFSSEVINDALSRLDKRSSVLSLTLVSYSGGIILL